MEAKLAEYRARKAKEQRNTETASQRFLGLFKRSIGNHSETSNSSAEAVQQSSGSATTAQHERESESEITEPPPPPPGKYSWLLCVLKVLLWVVTWMIFIELQFGAVFFAVSALVFVYINTRTGRKKNSLSAYSVFNPNCERLQGTITAEQFEAELLHRKPLPQS